MARFSDRTYENILKELLAEAPAKVDTRQGSIYFDAVAPCAMKLAAFYADIGLIVDLLSLPTATGTYLDELGREYGVERNPATPAKYQLVYEGTAPDPGTRFFYYVDTLYFFVEWLGGPLCLVSETSGEAANSIPEGSLATPVNTVEGLTRAEFGPLLEPGQAEETDDEYRQRIQEKIGGPAKNGNKWHYKMWCEEVDGVGRARILPLWAGANTVKAALLDPDGKPAADTVVARVQEYVDPGGTGLGEGQANIGAYFTAVAAEPLSVTVKFSLSLYDGTALEDVTAAITESIRSYLKDIAMNTADSENMVVRISSIGALIHATTGVVDYANLTVNGGTANISVDKDYVAVLEEVVIIDAV